MMYRVIHHGCCNDDDDDDDDNDDSPNQSLSHDPLNEDVFFSVEMSFCHMEGTSMVL